MGTDITVAEVFAERDYSGASLALSVGDYDIEALERSLGNDTISSLKVIPGYAVTLYTEPGFTGMSRTFSIDTLYVGDDVNDKISSVRVLASSRPHKLGQALELEQ